MGGKKNKPKNIKHVAKRKDNPIIYLCLDCKQNQDNSAIHIDHNRSRHKGWKFICPKCFNAFLTSPLLDSHRCPRNLDVHPN